MQTLTPEFMKDHSISKVYECFDRSGQKVVFIVEDTNGRKFAMKVFRNCSERDIQEIAILHRFAKHPGIAKIDRVEKDAQGQPLLFEEYIDGQDLEDIKASYAGDVTRIATLVRNIAEILKPIWLERIVHRDLKPKNIKILTDDKPIILDFGIARDLSIESITQTGDAQPMTWNYASPEQFAGDKGAISYRTDFFSIGVLAYSLFYQRHPFGSSRAEIEQKFQTGNNTIQLDDNELKKFFEGTLVISPSGRVRDPDTLIKLL